MLRPPPTQIPLLLADINESLAQIEQQMSTPASAPRPLPLPLPLQFSFPASSRRHRLPMASPARPPPAPSNEEQAEEGSVAGSDDALSTVAGTPDSAGSFAGSDAGEEPFRYVAARAETTNPFVSSSPIPGANGSGMAGLDRVDSGEGGSRPESPRKLSYFRSGWRWNR